MRTQPFPLAAALDSLSLVATFEAQAVESCSQSRMGKLMFQDHKTNGD
jgi:hypothetical protein